MDFILRAITLIILTFWRGYWHFGKLRAEREKPKTVHKSYLVEYIFVTTIGATVLLNLLGFVIFRFDNMTLRVLGLGLVISGFIISTIARKTLAANWAEAYEYQIKERHELVTRGIYKYARHPIYGGLLLMVPGSLLAAGSWLFLPMGIVLLVIFRKFAAREEILLEGHFGKKYWIYRKITKKFIPFVY